MPKRTVFGAVGKGGDWRYHAVVERRDDHDVAIGFAEAADVIIEHWTKRGPNDLLFDPLVYSHRHSLELILKVAIRETAARLRASGSTDREINSDAVDDWLTDEASHNLHKLAFRLDKFLTRLGMDQLPSDTHQALLSLHQLDPGGDAFRYAQVRGSGGRLVEAPRPLLSTPEDKQALVDVVAMHRHFRSAFSLLSDGVMTVLDNIAEMQAEAAHQAGRRTDH